MQTKLFCAGELNKAKVLVIGHDPRLRESNTQAEYAFFADYYFKPLPTLKNELAKYQLAETVYNFLIAARPRRILTARREEIA